MNTRITLPCPGGHGCTCCADGCDCGCGSFDPDCPNPSAWICDSCETPGSCAEGLGCAAIMDNDNSLCQ